MATISKTKGLVYVCILTYFSIFLKAYKANAVNFTGISFSPSSPLPSPVEFSLEYDNGVSDRGTLKITVELSKLEALPPDGAQKYSQLVKSQYGKYGNWEVVDAPKRRGSQSSLNGTFDIKRYEPCEFGPVCDISTGSGTGLAAPTKQSATIGALLGLVYLPATGDPSGIQTNYIQKLNTSYTTCVGQVPKQDKIDSCSSSPYYLPNNGAGFVDRPVSPDYLNDQFFNAELYLVQPGVGNKATMYDGIAWGWKSTVTKIPKSPTSLLSPSAPSAPSSPPLRYGYCISDPFTYCTYASTASILSTSTLNLDEREINSTDPSTIPTPALLPGIVATGIYHGRKWRKRKQKSQSDNPNDMDA